MTEAREMLDHMGATVADTVIAQRVALSHAIISGSTVNEYEPDAAPPPRSPHCGAKCKLT